MLKRNTIVMLSAGAALALGVASAGMVSAANTHQVVAADKKFSTKKLEVAVGDTITFVNSDKTKHNITIRKLKYNSGLQEPGQDVDVMFDKAGKFKVRCGIHPKMKLKVVVN